MKINYKRVLMTAAAAVLTLTLCAGFTVANAASSPVKDTVGIVLLSVNPEIQIQYDKKGDVVQVAGINEDGKNVVADYKGYKGKDCDDVAGELVKKIYDQGYFKQTVGGHEKNIVIKLEKGSIYPDHDFLMDVAEEVRETVTKCGLSSVPVTIDAADMGENGYISLDTAKKLVLTQLGFDEASFTEKEYKLDDGVYELEFTKDGIEYEFEVDAVSGNILEAEYDDKEWNGSQNPSHTTQDTADKGDAHHNPADMGNGHQNQNISDDDDDEEDDDYDLDD